MSLQRSFVVPGIVASSTQNQQMQNWLRASQSQSWESAGGDVHPSESTACLFQWGKSITERLPMMTRCDLDALLQGSALEGETSIYRKNGHDIMS